jgi:RimJ/RimL family protein N-acetyltransferase
MTQEPELDTARLRLRPFTLDDAARVTLLAGDREIAANTASIPHPYEEHMAGEWIGSHRTRFEIGEGVVFAVTLRSTEELVGTVGLEIRAEHKRAELGYWVGRPYWGQGYCTEAAAAVLKYAFEVLGLERVYAMHFKRNPASGRVMQKVGMRHEGELRRHFQKWNEPQDVEIYGILRDEFNGSRSGV